MNGTTHRIGGICAGLVCAEMLYGRGAGLGNMTLAASLVATSTLGSLMPDIDSKTSTISKKMPIFSFILNLFVGHRGIMHTYVPYILLGALTLIPMSFLSIIFQGATNFLPCSLFGYTLILVLGFFIGITSHFILDMITPMGVPILYPICKKKISVAKFKGDKHGTLICVLLVFATLIYLYYSRVGNFDVFIKGFDILKENISNFIETLTKENKLQEIYK